MNGIQPRRRIPRSRIGRRSDRNRRRTPTIGPLSRIFKHRGTRRSRISASIRPKGPTIVEIARQPLFVHGAVAVLVVAVLLTLVTTWTRSNSRVWPGEVATDSLVNPVAFSVLDSVETERRRTDARQASPRFYIADATYLADLRAKLMGLPVAARAKVTVDEVGEELQARFGLTDTSLTLLQKYQTPDGVTPTWRESVDEFIVALWNFEPLLETLEFQRFSTTPTRRVLPPPPIETTIPKPAEPKPGPDDAPATAEDEPTAEAVAPIADRSTAVTVDRAIELVPDEMTSTVRKNLIKLARYSGFPRDAAEIVVAAIINRPGPTVLFDPASTSLAADEAASRVADVFTEHAAGELIYARGDVLDTDTIELASLVLVNAIEAGGFEGTWSRVAGWMFLAFVVTVLLAGHGVTFYSRIARSTTRLVVVLLMLVGTTALASFFAVAFPRLAPFGAALAISILAITLTLAYDRRIAIFAGLLGAVCVTIAVGASTAYAIALLAVSSTLAFQLEEIPNRGAFVRASVVSSGVAALVLLSQGLATIPLGTDGAFTQAIVRAAFGCAGTLFAGFLMLGIMPSIEKLFDITTGLTLAELRDTRQPLLRELQSRAPGTYNHSLAVASIAENASEAIGADSRLVYVGGLYHDVGKLNKPEYFIENQGGGSNKHNKLSPAMSLLVIIGHVKDGLELAQEYGLPKSLRHFIESHHGTSLVEYFFHAAKEKAADEGGEVDEFEFRYPGPKPRTREAAILLLCDGIESATRAMGDPTPSRIESLVRRMCRRRLDDGQLDDSNLTFRELRVIEDSIIKSLCAIYHSRIAYPGGREERDNREEGEVLASVGTGN